MRFNESISKVLTTPAEWREWLGTIIKERHEWLRAQNYSGCYGDPDEEQPPDKYPVLVMMDATTHGFGLSYIYKDQIQDLLYGSSWVPVPEVKEQLVEAPIMEERAV